MDKTVVCCLIVRNSDKKLQSIFDNLTKLSSYILKFNVIFIFDNCSDNTEKMLYDYKLKSCYPVYVVHNLFNSSTFKTVRMANARNKYLYITYNLIKNVDFHIVIDVNDINCFNWNNELLISYLNNDNNDNNGWDCLTFNRRNYDIDMSSLMFDKYKHNLYDFGENSLKIVNHVKNKINEKINENLNKKSNTKLLECLSAFNVFAIYRSSKFYDIYYSGYAKNLDVFVTEEDKEIMVKTLQDELNDKSISIQNTKIEISEHIYYHLKSINKYNARIRFSSEYLDFLANT